VFQYNVSSSFSEVVLSVRCAFSKRSWPYVLATVVPWLLCSGQRSVTRIANMATFKRSLSSYYRFLSDGKWRMQLFFHRVFDLIVATFRIIELTLVVDDTLCPKWGRNIFGADNFFDHTARPRPGYIWGHNWVVLAVVVQFGHVGYVALPFWISLYRSEKRCKAGEFRTRHEMLVEELQSVREWFSGKIVLLADGAYNNKSVVCPARELGIEVVTRLRSDARLREPNPPRRRKNKRGRKPKRGRWLAKLSSLARSRGTFRTEKVRIYGKTVTFEVRDLVAYWPPLSCTARVVITRDPKKRTRVAYLMTTDVEMSATTAIEYFARRWTIEQMFAVTKTQMGFDSAEVRKEHSVKRHAALSMALVTWVEVWAYRNRKTGSARTFSRKLAALRAETISQTIYSSGPRNKGLREIADRFGAFYATATSAA